MSLAACGTLQLTAVPATSTMMLQAPLRRIDAIALLIRSARMSGGCLRYNFDRNGGHHEHDVECDGAAGSPRTGGSATTTRIVAAVGECDLASWLHHGETGVRAPSAPDRMHQACENTSCMACFKMTYSASAVVARSRATVGVRRALWQFVVAKHLCGSASDEAVLCVERSASSVCGAVLAPCCHQKMTAAEYTGMNHRLSHSAFAFAFALLDRV